MGSSWRQQFLKLSIAAAERWSALQERRAPPLTPGRILILTAYTADIAAYGDRTAANKQQYARHHGYDFQAITSGFDPARPPAWSKILFIRAALRSHPFVFWTDADALVMNESVRIESLVHPGIDLHLTEALAPHPHINTGQMLIRATAFSRLFLDAVWRLKAFTHDSTWEQRAINHLVAGYRFKRVRVSPNRVFNSYGEVPNDPDPYQDGDFIIHFPGVPDKVRLVNKYSGRPAGHPTP